MSATNTTTNYGLPIFIETDKPAWLVDFNGAMRTIDATLKTNADAIATKSPILTFNDTADIDFTKSGDIITANLSSGVAGTVSRALVKPVSAPVSNQLAIVDSSNNQQMVDIGSGLLVENGTIKTYDMNLTEYIEKTSANGDFSEVTSGQTVTGIIRFALNSDRTIGKIYGSVSSPANSYTGAIRFYTGLSLPNITEDIEITPAGITLCGSNPVGDFGISYITIQAVTGKVYINFSRYGANKATYAYLFPCIYFFKNFGDIPTP